MLLTHDEQQYITKYNERILYILITHNPTLGTELIYVIYLKVMTFKLVTLLSFNA